MSLENPHKIAKKDGHLHEIATKDGRLPYLVILCHYTVVRVSWRVLGKVHTYKILFNIVTSPIEIVPHCHRPWYRRGRYPDYGASS